jgi:hypothetical protein
MTRRQYHGAADLGAAALAYAAQGFRVLPLHYPTGAEAGEAAGVGCSCGDQSCSSIGKHPLTPHGLTDATRDPAQLGWWWRRWPQANIGLLTGELADVLDVDGLAGRAALRRWAATHGLHLDGPLARTGNGWHYYLAPAGTRNRAGLLEHVDWRGIGGYAVAPPSRHSSGSRYRWLRPLTPDLPQVPEPLQDLLVPKDRQRAQPAPLFRPVATGHPYGRKALDDELADVASAPKGRRNHTLYQAGIRLYSLVAGGVLDHAQVQDGLLAAADASRLLADEPLQTRRTLASAERTGLAHPRSVPARKQPPPRSTPPPTRRRRGRQDRERGG